MRIVYISESLDGGGANKAGYRYLIPFIDKVDILSLQTIGSVSSVKANLLFIQRIVERIFSRIFHLDENIDLNLLGRVKYESLKSYDVIILNSMGHGFLSWPTLLRLRRKRVIFINHDHYFFNGCFHYPPNSISQYVLKWYTILLFYSLRRFTGRNECIFIFPSKYLYHQFMNLNYERIRPLYIKYPYADRKERSSEHDKLRILIIADSLKNKRKGLDRLLNFILNNNSNFEFNIVGSGLSEDIMQRVNYHGYISSQNELNKLYRYSDVVLIPSRQDNAPLVALEAFENGCHVLYSTTNGLVEYFNRFAGILCDFDSEMAIESSLSIIRDLDRSKFFIHGNNDLSSLNELLS